ncbi:MAG: rubredoxin-like domain-containing protein [Candidatus Zixiibacteriota bacterium]
MKWVCDICGYVHDDEELPDGCPLCGAPPSKFTKKKVDED